jgi:outer membrane protein assembly factor BamB
LPVLLVLGLLIAIVSCVPRNPAKEGTETRTRDWPMLGGTMHRNMVNTVEKDMPTTWSVKEGGRKNVKWVAELGMTSFGVPVIADGKVFVGTNNDQPRDPQIKGDKGVLMCFRESDGKFLWQAVHDKLPTGQENDWPHQGVASSPVVEGKRLYYVSNRCEVVCANTEGKDGKADIVWRLDMVKDLEVYPRYLAICSPLIVGDLLYVVTGNGATDQGGKLAVVNPKAPNFLAIDKKTAKVAWQKDLPGAKIMDGQWSNPAAAEVNGKMQVVFPAGDGWLYGLDAKTGDVIWKFDCNPKDAKPYKAGGRGECCFFLGSPVIYENKVYVGLGQEPENDGQGPGQFWCVDITKTGDVSPELVVNESPLKTEPNKNSAKVWGVNGLIKQNGKDRDYAFGRTVSTPAVHDGLVYMTDMDSFFYCFDARTGDQRWEEDLKSSIWGSPYWVDGKVYVPTDDGEVHIFAPGKDKKFLGKVSLDGGQIKAPVVAANGVLYVMTGKTLYALTAH